MQGLDPAGYAPSWYTATMVPASAQAPLTTDLDVDVCVIGAGLAGLTAAREIARSGWKVALLEADRVAWNASGRNCGFVLPGFGPPIDQIVARVGRDHARELWRLSEEGLDYVRRTIEETGMPGIDPVDGWLNVAKIDDPEGMSAALKVLGDFGVPIEVWTASWLRQMLRTPRYFRAIYYPRAFHLHPLNYALGLAAAAHREGVQIFEQTPALAIDPDGVRKRIETPRGRVRAAHAVLAGNVHIAAMMPKLAGTLLPIWTYLAVTAPLGERLADAVAFTGAVSDGERADNHYRIVDGDRLLISGRATVWEASPRWFARGLAADLTRLYPQLAPVAIEHLWSGVLGRTIHGMPQIGELSPGIWLASGFGGHGLNTTAMAGNLIARAIVDGDDRWRLFLPYELIWAGGRAGRLVAQVSYVWSRASGAVRARQARLREARSLAVPPPAAPAEPVSAMAEPTGALPADAPAEQQAVHPQAPAFGHDDAPVNAAVAGDGQ